MDILLKLDQLTVRLAEEFNLVNTQVGNLTLLPTTDKTSLVNSLIEIKGMLDSLESFNVINDAINSSSSVTWSINKIKSYINLIIEGLFTNVPVEHDSLKKISDAILAITLNLTNYVSYSPQTKTELEKTEARANISAASTDQMQSLIEDLNTLQTSLGNLNADFLQDFLNEL